VHGSLEKKLIRELAARAPGVLATVPQGDARTVAALEESLACSRSHSPSTKAANSLSFAKQHLFEDSLPLPAPLDSTVKLENWPGEPRECVEIVRSIQAEAAARCAISIRWRSCSTLLATTGLTWRRLFFHAQIPTYFVRGTTAPDPAGPARALILRR
jgi:hypothetical protein